MTRSKVTSAIVRDLIIGLALLVGIMLIPDQTHGSLMASLQVAMNSKWAQILDWPAAWCSVKVLLAAFGLFLVMEAAGTLFAQWRFNQLASLLYLSVLLPCGLLAFGVFLLVKALL
jgi:hypothetical protein